MSGFSNAIAAAVVSAIEEASDSIVRVSAARSWPMQEALQDVLAQFPESMIGIVSPFRETDFEQLPPDRSSADAALLTQLRNGREVAAVGGPPLIIVGDATGQEESGLRQVHVVVALSRVVKHWSEAIAEALKHFRDANLQVRREFVDEVVSWVNRARLSPTAAGVLIDEALSPDSDLLHLQRRLYMIDLLPDSGLAGGDVVRRLRANRQLIEDLRSGDADGQLTHLGASSDPEVNALARWIESRLDSDLAGADFRSIEEFLKQMPRTGGNGPTRNRTYGLLDLLQSRDLTPPDREKLLDDVVNAVPAGFHRKADFEYSGQHAGLRLRVERSYVASEADVWLTGLLLNSDGEFDRVDTIPAIVAEIGEDLSPLRTAFTSLAEMLNSEVLRTKLEAFLEVRAQLLHSARMLASDDQQLLEILLIAPDLRQTISSYIEAWREFMVALVASADAGRSSALAFALIEAVWCRELQDSEDSENLTLSWESAYTHARLAPWHPWRLGPLLQLSDLVVNSLGSEPTSVGSALWAIDRAVPAYRLITAGTAKLQFRFSRDGECIFDAGTREALPPLRGKPRLLTRAINAYASTHPWSQLGATLTFCNPPHGGSVVELVSHAATQFGELPAVVFVRTASTVGVDQIDDVPGLIATRDVDRLSDWTSETDLSQDIAVAFLKGSAALVGLRHGSHGAIEISLEARALAADGRQIREPQIQLSDTLENEHVRLLYSAAGLDHVDSARFSLSLPTSDRAQLEAVLPRTGWLVVCIPGTISAFDLHLPNGSPCARIAEFDEGEYKCFVFAQVLTPVENLIRQKIDRLPIPTVRKSEIHQALAEIAVSQPQKLFDVAVNRYGPEEALGVIAARAVARENCSTDSLVLEVSLDDSSWSQEWLSQETSTTGSKRADFLLVEVSSDPTEAHPIRFTVVEAKAVSIGYESPMPSVYPFDEAVGQVEATKNLLESLLQIGSGDLVSRLRFRALTEQLAGLAAYCFLRDQENDSFDVYFRHLTTFSSKGIESVESVRGLAVGLFLGGLEPTGTSSIGGDLQLVSGSAKLLGQALRDERIDVASVVREPSSASREVSADSASTVRPADVRPATEAPESGGGTAQVDEVEVSVETVVSLLRLRSADVGVASDAVVTEGPTFRALSLQYRAGASIQPLQRAESDIARDIGAQTVEIDNAQEQGRIRVLVPRRTRVFPELPAKDDLLVAGSSEYLNLYLGKDLAGHDYRSALSQWPHALIAGSTGSGKTTFIRNMLRQIGDTAGAGVRAIVVDGKGESDYVGVLPAEAFDPEFPEPAPNMASAIRIFDWLREHELPRRRSLLNDLAAEQGRRVDARSLFVASCEGAAAAPVAPLVVVIDEFNELMLAGGRTRQQFADGVTSIAQIARSALVHLVLCTQRPDRTVLPGTIKTNLNAKFAFRLASPSDSVIVLGRGGAERLLGRGDMIVQMPGYPDARLQAYRD